MSPKSRTQLLSNDDHCCELLGQVNFGKFYIADKNDMGPEMPFELLASDVIQSLIGKARRRLAELPRTDSNYRILLEAARIHQEIGNAISERAYEAAVRQIGLACARGCHACCLIPSEARGIALGNFSMSMLDVVTIIEHYERIKKADMGLPARARRAAAEARRTQNLVQCPYLGTAGECSIYAHRPVACKIWFSAELALCMKNRQQSYKMGVNDWTDASNRLRKAFEEPFAALFREIMPDTNFDGYDFLLIFEDIAKLDGLDLFDIFRSKVDTGELSAWAPFE